MRLGASVHSRNKKIVLKLAEVSEWRQCEFGARMLAERYRLYCEQYKDYPKFIVGQYEFNRVCKILDEKISNWRNKEDKEIYLTTFSVDNWNKGKTISKEIKKHIH